MPHPSLSILFEIGDMSHNKDKLNKLAFVSWMRCMIICFCESRFSLNMLKRVQVCESVISCALTEPLIYIPLQPTPPNEEDRNTQQWQNSAYYLDFSSCYSPLLSLVLNIKNKPFFNLKPLSSMLLLLFHQKALLLC